MHRHQDKSLILKYNIPGPRYTSYPTVPYWDDKMFDRGSWIESLKRSFKESNSEEGISLYIHLPYCESLCTFCACHKRITKQHSVELPYIQTVLKEWELYCELFDDVPIIKELHLGGGTPTFFSPENLTLLIQGIMSKGSYAENFEFSFEGHPNNTSEEHLRTLYELGFRRTSFGVQDYDPLVQLTIKRIQPFENVKKVSDLAKEIGYTSVSHDLVFGLPNQTIDSIIDTIQLTKSLKPDRIAFYSYAHVPWVKNVGQRGYKESDLPSAEIKREMYEKGKDLLDQLGYYEIGMDHFALQTDSLYQSMVNNHLHRNFMGYTSSKTQLMVGLGMSSISDSWYAFAQNEKKVEDYISRVEAGKLPVFRGHLLSDEDLIVRKHILNLMCNFETRWNSQFGLFEGLEESLKRLTEMEKDGLVSIQEGKLFIPIEGRPFIRNICMAFDLHLHENKPSAKLFSMTI